MGIIWPFFAGHEKSSRSKGPPGILELIYKDKISLWQILINSNLSD